MIMNGRMLMMSDTSNIILERAGLFLGRFCHATFGAAFRLDNTDPKRSAFDAESSTRLLLLDGSRRFAPFIGVECC